MLAQDCMKILYKCLVTAGEHGLVLPLRGLDGQLHDVWVMIRLGQQVGPSSSQPLCVGLVVHVVDACSCQAFDDPELRRQTGTVGGYRNQHVACAT